MSKKPQHRPPPAQQAPATKTPSWRDLAAENGTPLAIGGTAVALAGLALLNHANARKAEAKTPPVGKFVEVEGVSVHYLDEGSGPPVVLLHGNGVTLQDYTVSGVVAALSGNHRVIAFDRPGFGYTERPRTTIWTPQAQAALLAGALERIGVGPAVVVGHSWGSMVALAMGLNHRAAVSGLVLMSGYYYGTVRPDVVPFGMPGVPLLGDVMAQTVSPIAGALLGPVAIKASFSPAEVSEKFADFPIGLALRPSQVRATGADTAMMVPGAVSMSGRVGELDMPVVIMAGEGDKIAFVSKHAERLAGDIDNSDLRIVPGQGHLFHYAVPEQVAAAVDSITARS